MAILFHDSSSFFPCTYKCSVHTFGMNALDKKMDKKPDDT